MVRIKPDVLEYKDLLHEIEGGTIKIPAFQRDFVWEMDRAVSLLDSIAKGYPIGTFLFWESSEFMNHLREIGGRDFAEVPEGRLVNYVLDGQQRITSLYACLRDLDIKNRSYAVYCDLDKDVEDTDIFCLECPDSARFVLLSQILGDDPQHSYDSLSPERKAKFNSLRDAFRYYRFSVIKVVDANLDVVCEIFERVNNSGMELTVFDLMVAKTWQPEFDLRERFDEMEANIEPRGYNGISESVVLQAVASHLREACSRKEILSIKREEMKKAWDASLEAFYMAIEFVRSAIGIPASRFLPYPAVLVPISYLFWKNGMRSCSSGQVRLLKQYYWRAGLSQRYSSGVENKLREDLGLMRKIMQEEIEDVGMRTQVTADIVKDTWLSLSNASSKAILGALATRRPASYLNGGRVVLDNSHLVRANSRHYHHIFPKAYLARKGKSDWANCIANISLVSAFENLAAGSKPPKAYLKEIEKDNPNLRNHLSTHLIGARAYSAIEDDDYGAFLEARAQSIARHLDRLATGK